VLVAGLVTRSSAGSRSRFELGRPLAGLTSDERQQFREGKEAFEEAEDVADGLGPIFNGTSCAGCHSDPATGGSADIDEIRAQRVDALGTHFDEPGGSLFQSDAIRAECREVVRGNVRAERQTTPLFGMGLIEAIPDAQIEGYAAQQAQLFPHQAGRANRIVDLTSQQLRVGRFGWKCQVATLLTFSADAYLNEMGITTPELPTENAPNDDQNLLRRCDAVADPEDTDNDIALFANFMRLLAPPPGDEGCGRPGHRHRSGRRGMVSRGERVFDRIGCAVCHYSGYTAESRIGAIDGENVDALSDFLLHDVGTGDNIEQAGAAPNELRTAPLWGVADSPPFLHDGSARTLVDAILRHQRQGAAAQEAFRQLSHQDRIAMLVFLNSL
jgi:CxxC motif-containing protein (DUF1111 family)